MKNQGEVRVSGEFLHAFTREVFVRVGLPQKDATIEADVLVWANLRGVDSHGVQRIPGYIERSKNGQMNSRPDIQILQETPATAFIEADFAFGPVVTILAMDLVMKKAGEVGIGWGFIRNTTHQGAIGYYVQRAALNDMVGLLWVCNPPNMAPHGAKVAGVDNSPIAIGVPGNRFPPIVLDMATSIAAAGKLQVAIDEGVSIPRSWALDKNGNPTTDARRAVVLQPAGGYKGYALAFMLECITSLMVGNPIAVPILTSETPVPAAGHHGAQNSVVVAIDIKTFTDVSQYKMNVDAFIQTIKGLPKADGFEEIFVPGETEEIFYQDRVQHGIPLPPGTIIKLQKVSEEFDIPLPRGL